MSALASEVLTALEELAPLGLAEPWDNVGLLLDPVGLAVAPSARLERALLTIELTAETLSEAQQKNVDFVIAYHPPIFTGLKRLSVGRPSDAVLLRAIVLGMCVYSPHTALDAARGGMAEWLAAGVGAGHLKPITPHASDPALGAGRLLTLSAPASLEVVLARVKAHLGLSLVRVATPVPERPVRTVAVCPGAGGALFDSVGDVDLFVTGEMRHHDVLARRARGAAVLLTDHSHSERGYLPFLAERLRTRCPGLTIEVSERDQEPLQIR